MSIDKLLAVESRHDEDWLKEALQASVELEFFTIPPYLTALWSIVDETSYAARTIREVVYEEMQHMALACNLLAAIGGVPSINREPAIPVYPRPMPGGVRPDLIIGLAGLSPEAIKGFMQIEMPEKPLVFPQDEWVGAEGIGETFTRIGAFYQAIQEAFHVLDPKHFAVDRQVAGKLAPLIIDSLDAVDAAIEIIRIQGEGSNVSPLGKDEALRPIEVATGGADNLLETSRKSPDLAHYYRFQEIDQRQRLVYKEVTRDFRWGEPLPFPEVYPVAAVPAGGYRKGDVTAEVAEALDAFDRAYTVLLDQLQGAWGSGGQGDLVAAIGTMFLLHDHARTLMRMPILGTETTYGPCFRYRGQGKRT